VRQRWRFDRCWKGVLIEACFTFLPGVRGVRHGRRTIAVHLPRRRDLTIGLVIASTSWFRFVYGRGDESGQMVRTCARDRYVHELVGLDRRSGLGQHHASVTYWAVFLKGESRRSLVAGLQPGRP